MKKSILVKGPVLSRSGYGYQARFALKALRSREDLFDIYIQNIPWGRTGWIWRDDEFRRWADERILAAIARTQQGGKFDMSLQITIPNEWEKITPVNIGYTAGIETTRVAPQWLQKGNDMDRIITISQHSKTTYEETIAEAKNTQTGQTSDYRLETPIEFVNYAVEDIGCTFPIENLELATEFNFLCLSQWGPRKNIENTIRWFVEEFKNEEVGLVVKANIACDSLTDFHYTQNNIKNELSSYPERKCKIYLLHGDMSREQLSWLYKHENINALINLAHGEGFGLPMFEAAYHGLPVITVGWSGQLDYLVDTKGKEHFYSVEYTIQPIQESAHWPGVLEPNSLWSFADIDSAKKQMRKCYSDLTNGKTSRLMEATAYAKELAERFSKEKMYEKFISSMGFEKPNFDVDYIFVSDMFKNQYSGGAELSLQTLIDSCPDGKMFKKVNSSNLTKSTIDNNLDSLFVFGNIAQLKDETLQYIIDSGLKYYFIEYDYKYCEYRNPVLYEFLEDEACDYLQTEKALLIQKFINNSINTFFMSQGQLQIYENDLAGLNKDKLVVLSSTFEDEFFDKINSLNEQNKNVERKKWIVLGSRSWVKGVQQSENWCKTNNIDYEVVDNLSHDDMLKKLSLAKGICFKPSGLDTCPRFVIEAKLLGCELELNENVQHLSEPWFATSNTNEIMSYLKDRKQFFWSHIE